jgi:hypothetical protein
MIGQSFVWITQMVPVENVLPDTFNCKGVLALQKLENVIVRLTKNDVGCPRAVPQLTQRLTPRKYLAETSLSPVGF